MGVRAQDDVFTGHQVGVPTSHGERLTDRSTTNSSERDPDLTTYRFPAWLERL